MRNRRAVFRALFCGVFVFLAASGAMVVADEDAESDIVVGRSILHKLVETKRIIFEEKQEWSQARLVLRDQIDVVQDEIRSLRTGINDADSKLAKTNKDYEELKSENEQLQGALDALSDVLVRIEKGTKELLPRLPEPIRDQVEPFSQQIPEDPEAKGLTSGKRFMNLVGVLNGVNKFHGEVKPGREVHQFPDGTAAEVDVFYIGISKGYYVGTNGQVAGTGTGAPGGWTWTPANEFGAEIAAAVRILQGEPARFVRLPIRIDD